jgi:uncharacterized delta-60 repeat protein
MGSRSFTVLVCVLLLYCFSAQPAVALPGDLDPTFGHDGVVKVFVPPGPPEANAMAIQSDGKIVVAGTNNLDEGTKDRSKFVLARFISNGSLDPTFGGDGIVTTNFTAWRDHAYSLAIQADGKIVATGVVGEGGGDAAMGLVRYDTDGSLDPTFGTGGKVTTNFPCRNACDDYGNTVAIQADGRIVVGGLSRCCGNARFAVTRYETDGSLDSTFGGGDGMVTDDITSSIDFGFSIAIQEDGDIVLAGQAGAFSMFGIVRFAPDGTPDSTFGQGGTVTTTVGSGGGATSVAIQADGKIVVLGGTGGEDPAFGLVRYETDGSLDQMFGSGGMVTTDFSPIFDWAQKVAIQADGKIVAVGGSAFTGGGTQGEFALARYNQDGTPDTTFGTDGQITADLTRYDDIGIALAIQADGRIVVAGDSGLGGRHPKIALARFLGS